MAPYRLGILLSGIVVGALVVTCAVVIGIYYLYPRLAVQYIPLPPRGVVFFSQRYFPHSENDLERRVAPNRTAYSELLTTLLSDGDWHKKDSAKTIAYLAVLAAREEHAERLIGAMWELPKGDLRYGVVNALWAVNKYDRIPAEIRLRLKEAHAEIIEFTPFEEVLLAEIFETEAPVSPR